MPLGEYLQAMAHEDAWGGRTELRAVSHLFGCAALRRPVAVRG